MSPFMSNASIIQQSLPVGCPERARHRHGSIVPHEPVHWNDPCNEFNKIVRHRMAVQIVYKPAACGMCVHPADKPYQIVIAEMMGKKTADDKIRILRDA